MYRFAEEYLNHWIQKENRKPLVIRGARQVGKSTLVRQFCQKQGYSLVEINLEVRKVGEFNKKDTFDAARAFQEIELLIGRPIEADSVLFIDEIQEQPLALNRLRYLYESRPRLAIVCAGSLLELKAAKENFQMPVGRIEYLFLGPMTFCEYLMAKGEGLLAEKILRHPQPLAESVHNKLVDLLREFYYVGGMPEAVRLATETGRLVEVRDVQRNLMQTYRDDFPKYAGAKADLLQLVFDWVPANTGSKIKYSAISDVPSRDLKAAVSLLVDARVIYKVSHTDASGLPLRVQEDPNVYKLYFIDVGLMNCALDVDWRDLTMPAKTPLLANGRIAEQFVAQHLLFREGGLQPPRLNYWLRDKSSKKAEVDFILSEKQTILPVEVKAGKVGTVKSLLQFLYEKKLQRAVRFDLQFRESFSQEIRSKIRDKNEVVEVRGHLVNLPLYMVEGKKTLI